MVQFVLTGKAAQSGLRRGNYLLANDHSEIFQGISSVHVLLYIPERMELVL